jgi:hypothetical protein
MPREKKMQASLFHCRAVNANWLYENLWRIQAAILAAIAIDYLVQYAALPMAIVIVTHALIIIGAPGAVVGLQRLHIENLPSYPVSYVGPYAVYGYLQVAWVCVGIAYFVHIVMLLH